MPFWLSYWSGRNVSAVEVNGYTIEPGANLEGAYLFRANLRGAQLPLAYLFGADLTEP